MIITGRFLHYESVWFICDIFQSFYTSKAKLFSVSKGFSSIDRWSLTKVFHHHCLFLLFSKVIKLAQFKIIEQSKISKLSHYIIFIAFIIKICFIFSPRSSIIKYWKKKVLCAAYCGYKEIIYIAYSIHYKLIFVESREGRVI